MLSKECESHELLSVVRPVKESTDMGQLLLQWRYFCFANWMDIYASASLDW